MASYAIKIDDKKWLVDFKNGLFKHFILESSRGHWGCAASFETRTIEEAFPLATKYIALSSGDITRIQNDLQTLREKAGEQASVEGTCAGCKFYFPTGEDLDPKTDTLVNKGECRFKSPVCFAPGFRTFPVVSPTDFCGDYKAKV